MDVSGILVQLGLEAGGGATVEFLRRVVLRFGAWAGGGQLDRLFAEIDERFGDEPAFSSVGLRPVREDPEFVLLLAMAVETGRFSPYEFVPVIRKHVGQTATQSEEELAFQIATQIGRFLSRAEEDPTEGIHLHLDFLESSVTQQIRDLPDEIAERLGDSDPESPIGPSPRSEGQAKATGPTNGHVPKLVRERLADLAARNRNEAVAIETSIFGGKDARSDLRTTVTRPPAWLTQASQAAWVTLAEIGDRYALWDVAEIAFARAAEQPGPMRASCLARASAAARNGGRLAKADELLAQARAIDASDPDILFTELFRESDEGAKIPRLDAMPEPLDERQRWFRHIARAQALHVSARYDEARAALDQADLLRPHSLPSRIHRALIALSENADRHQRDHAVDRSALLRSTEQLLEIRDDLAEVGRVEESGLFLSYAARAAAIAGDKKRARSLLLDELDETERQAVIAAGHPELAAAAALVDDELVRHLTPDAADTETSRLAWAQAVAIAGDAQEVPRAVEVLDDLCSATDEDVRRQAASSRLALAIEDPTTSWSDSAENVLRELDAPAAAMLGAERDARRGRVDEAKGALLPHLDDPHALRVYVSILARQDEWGEVVNVLRPVVEAAHAPVSRKLMFAEAARRSGSRPEAMAMLSTIQSDTTIAEDDRDHAFHLSCVIAEDVEDYGQLERLTADWLRQVPDQEEALWRRVFALFQLARHDEALELIERHALEPKTESEARLVALVLDRAAPIETTVMRLRELSDRFGRPERLEALLLMTALRWREERPDEIGVELSQRLTDFVERYPESQAIKAIPIEPSDEGVDRLFREFVEPGAAQSRSHLEEIVNGTLAVPVLAGSSGRPLAFIWWELQGMLPLALPDAALLDLERSDASEWIGRAVVRDPSSLVIPRFLAPEIQDAIAAAFPGSRIARATLADVDHAADYADSVSGEHLIVGADPSSGEWWRADVPAEVAGERASELSMVRESARAFGYPDPDVDPNRPTEFDSLVQDKDDVGAGFLSWPISFALAQRRQLALYSDDRVVRLEARRAQMPTFGTVALLDSLAARGLISQEQHSIARQALRARGGLGLADDVDELIGEARAADWRVTSSLHGALLDRTKWRAQPGEAARFWLPFLSASREAPEVFPRWVGRVVDAAVLSWPNGVDHDFFARSLLLVSLMSERADGLFGDMIEPIRQLLRDFGVREDPLLGALMMLEEFLQQPAYRPVAHSLRRYAISQLSLRDQLAFVLGLRIRERWE